jgi:hypothetical protein
MNTLTRVGEVCYIQYRDRIVPLSDARGWIVQLVSLRLFIPTGSLTVTEGKT